MKKWNAEDSKSETPHMRKIGFNLLTKLVNQNDIIRHGTIRPRPGSTTHATTRRRRQTETSSWHDEGRFHLQHQQLQVRAGITHPPTAARYTRRATVMKLPIKSPTHNTRHVLHCYNAVSFYTGWAEINCTPTVFQQIVLQCVPIRLVLSDLSVIHVVVFVIMCMTSYMTSATEQQHVQPSEAVVGHLPSSLLCGQLLTILNIVWRLPHWHLSLVARPYFLWQSKKR